MNNPTLQDGQSCQSDGWSRVAPDYCAVQRASNFDDCQLDSMLLWITSAASSSKSTRFSDVVTKS